MVAPIPRGPFDQGLFLAHYNKGKELFEARKLEAAERQLEEAYLLRPRDPRVLNLLGLVYFRGEKLDKAEEVYRKLIADSPDAETLHYNLGLICFKLGRFNEAELAFLKALELSRGNPKIHFYLGSIYERLHRYKDAIFRYREAGAHRMVQRLQGRLGPAAAQAAAPPPPASAEAPPDSRPDTTPPQPAPRIPDAPPEAVVSAPEEAKTIRAVSPSLMAGDGPPPGRATLRFPPEGDTSAAARARAPAAAAPPPPDSRPAGTASRDTFRGLERGLMEVDFSGKVFIKQGTIYSYSGKLTFWVKDKRPGARPALVIVTGTGRLILTDQERDITFMQVADEPVFVEPVHLLACEEGLQPRYVRFGDEAAGLEVVALEGRGMVALSVASKPLPLAVKPDLPVSVPTSSVIMWTGRLAPHVVSDPDVYAVVLASAAGSGRLLRLEGTGQVVVEQASPD
jgi:uncharacterized protein (AIM24 family)